MMRIGPNAAGTAGTGSLPEPDHSASRYQRPPGEDDIGRNTGERRDALGGDLREGAHHAGTQQREAQSRNAFEQSLKRALDRSAPQEAQASAADGHRTHDLLKGRGEHEVGDDDRAGQVDAATLRLLALAERPPGFALAPAAPSVEVAPAGTEQAARVDALALRIEEAVRAELYAAPGRPIALKLDLGGLVPGLLSVTVAMTPEGIDVTLARGAGEASAELVQAAQALAERLQTRFAKRIVRVLDAPAAAAPVDASSTAVSRPPEDRA